MLFVGGSLGIRTNNSIGPAFSQSRLDRVFINQSWIDMWPEPRLEFFSGTKECWLPSPKLKKGKKPFRVFN